MTNTIQTASDYKGISITAWVLIGVTCLVSLIPGVGFLTWIVGFPVLFVTMILGIVTLAKGGTLQGVLILLVSLIAAPIFLIVAPIITTGGAIAASAGAVENLELEGESLEGLIDTAEDSE